MKLDLTKAVFLSTALICVGAGLSAQTPEMRIVQGSELAPTNSMRPGLRQGDGIVPNTSGATLQAAPSTASEPVNLGGPEAAEPRRQGFLGRLFRPRGDEPSELIEGGGSALSSANSSRPEIRPEGVEERVRETATRNTPGRVAQPGENSGRLCGVIGLQGERIDPVPGRIRGCGIPEPVRLRVVHGVTLTQPATINCATAQALSNWMLEADRIIGNTGGGMANLRVVASYACRTRNSQRGARLSEHSTGNAIDIAGIGLEDGSELSVLNDWRSGRASIMQGLHSAACGPFGTVLGPNSDRFHRDHFHFDVASYRSGPYCR